MITTPSTNATFSNQDPSVQINRCFKENGNYEENFATHFICSKCIEIMNRNKKSHTDYNEFIEVRTKNFYDHIEKTYKIHRAKAVNDDENIVDTDEEAS